MFLFLGCIFALAMVWFFPNQILSPLAYMDFRACQQVHPGMSEANVLELMGEPRRRVSRSSGEQYFYFRRQQMDSDPIEISFKDHGAGYKVVHAVCNDLG
jgi:outer membrane protein assembly factor BamE (lipoprotein component of BamABCDE complex)